MQELLRRLPAEGNYEIHFERGRSSRIKLFAPHGGCIEPCTEPIAMAIAMDDYDWYVFSGRRRTSCFATLHVTSTRYDEPVCMEMAEEAELALAIHGCEGETSGVILGGGNEAAVASLKGHLRDAGYTVLDAPDHLQGHNDRNFINRARRRGVQIELTTGLRRELFPGYPKSLQRHPREFQRFIGTMRAWLGSGLS